MGAARQATDILAKYDPEKILRVTVIKEADVQRVYVKSQVDEQTTQTDWYMVSNG